MQNKEMINKLRDNAELAWAAYGYFHLANPNYDFNKDSTDKKRLEYFRELKAKELGRDLDENTYPTLSDILNIEYKYFKDENSKPQDSWYHKHFLGGDLTPTQTKNFLERYDILIHQPNTHSGFSATLFGKKRLQINNKTKEKSSTAEYGYINYILAFRGTEDKNDLLVDKDLVLGKIPKEQYFDMLLFYNQCIGKIPFYVTSESKSKGEDTSFICDKLDIKCSHSVEYKLWEKIYIQSTQTEYKPYIAESLLKDSTLPPTSSNFTPPIDSTTKLTLTGHSLGGCLAQLFALSFATAESQRT